MATRREFIKMSAAAGAGVAICGCSAAGEKKVFTDSERGCLAAVAEQIIPADDEWGGASDAGVINYIENWAGKYYPEMLPIYRNGVAGIQKACRRLYSRDFQDLEFEAQTGFLKKMEAGKLPREDWEGSDQRGFFRELLTRSMQGFYGPPRHGGNKDYMSYRMCGLDMPHVLGQNRYGGR